MDNLRTIANELCNGRTDLRLTQWKGIDNRSQNGRLSCDLSTKCRRWDKACESLPKLLAISFVRDEEECLVSCYGSAKAPAKLIEMEWWLVGIKSVDRLCRVEEAIPQKIEDPAVELVRT